MAMESYEDEELMESILEGFEDDGRINMNYIDVEVVDGSITVSGRVSSDEEMTVIEEVMEGLKIKDYNNKVWIDDTLSYEGNDDEADKMKGVDIDDDDDIDDQDYEDEEEDDSF